jgi:hypothetical protein
MCFHILVVPGPTHLETGRVSKHILYICNIKWMYINVIRRSKNVQTFRISTKPDTAGSVARFRQMSVTSPRIALASGVSLPHCVLQTFELS